MQSTQTRWLRRQQVETMLADAGMPCSRATVERLSADPDSGFPEPRQLVDKGTRLWDSELVAAFIARSRCFSNAADQTGDAA